MPKLAKNLRKLWRMSADEIRVRGSQQFSALAERRGWSALAKLPGDKALLKVLTSNEGHDWRSDGEFLEHFSTRTKPGFFQAFVDKKSAIKELTQRWPGAERETIERAERIAEGRFDLLGLRGLSFGSPIDWQLEPIASKRVPVIHWSKLDYLDAEIAGDKKVIWEFNRHQYFITLGQAYWLTSDERYAKTFFSHLESWMQQNPPKLGINWASSLEIAFRSISWLWAFYFFKDSPSLNPRTFMRALKFLYLNARHLETYLSTYFSPNTHLTGEALGLFYLGTLLPEFNEAGRWKDKGREILLTQLDQHVRPDGVYFEQSSYYHRYTTDFYLHLLILSGCNHETLPAKVEDKLKALLDHLMYITRPDGTTPFFGDDDGGRLLTLDEQPNNDFRAALATGAALFGRADYKFVAAEVAQETLWLLGSPGLEKFDLLQKKEPAKQSVAFKDSGYYVMRDGWTSNANYLLFDAGPHGALSCGHAHADALSFELAPGGRTLLVDPGTYTYTGSKEMRDWFRSSPAHNTLTLDGESSSLPAGPFSWKSVAESRAEKWISCEPFDYVEAKHNGYARLRQPATHKRSILFVKHDYWIIRDQVSSEGEHRADLSFHFVAGAVPLVEVVENQSIAIVVHDGLQGLSILSFAREGRWRREEGWVSHCYGDKAPARVYVFSAPVSNDADLVTFLLPQAGVLAGKRLVRDSEAIGGKAFEVAHDNGFDLVMIRSSDRVESARLVSDFDWTWARFSSGEENAPTELVLINGTSLELNGRQILRSEKRIDYLVAGRIGNQFRIETNEGLWELPLPISNYGEAFEQLPFSEKLGT
ncbi:MAG TPA: alginate lyase family protein [Pyrinomonadaceae bacterium]|nr:alginate lyase family protein [Pyrinomonadaceae bacterium]